MKISKIYIKGFQQFKDVEIDLTYPKGHEKEGQPLDKICFIGRNGTGKSTLLREITNFIRTRDISKGNNFLGVNSSPPSNLLYKLKIQDSEYYGYSQKHFGGAYSNTLLNADIEKDITAFKYLLHFHHNPPNPNSDKKDLLLSFQEYNNRIKEFIASKYELEFKSNSNDLLIYCPPEGTQNKYKGISDVPDTTLDKALPLLKNFPFYHEVSTDTINNFWNILIYQIKKRENDFRIFESKPENQNRTVKEVKEEFDLIHPKILIKVSELWNKILEKAGLEFDVERASNPIQLTDNLKAYIRLISSKQRINYHQLSTGIRNFIFRLGHIYSLYFNKNIERGYLLIDEPENSLYPDFLYDLIDTYLGLTQNTQFFVSTHSPIIAAQFEPYERIILDFDDEGYITTRKGVIPVGDDPNDILSKDFHVRNLMGKEGVKKWERYIELKILIQKEKDMETKSKLADEFINIGNTYNFDLNALS